MLIYSIEYKEKNYVCSPTKNKVYIAENENAIIATNDCVLLQDDDFKNLIPTIKNTQLTLFELSEEELFYLKLKYDLKIIYDFKYFEDNITESIEKIKDS